MGWRAPHDLGRRPCQEVPAARAASAPDEAAAFEVAHNSFKELRWETLEVGDRLDAQGAIRADPRQRDEGA